MRHNLKISLVLSLLVLLWGPLANAQTKALPLADDGRTSSSSPKPQVSPQSFEGIDASQDYSAGFTIDPNGEVGTKQFMEWVDSTYQGYGKTSPFTPVYASPLPGDTPWVQNNMPDCQGAGGNGVILFDHLASRWVVGVRQTNNDYFFCIAVSNTDDLTSSSFAWYTYELDLNAELGQNSEGATYYPDYPRFGTWSDGYYTAIDLLDPNEKYKLVGVMVCAFDRADMLTGGTALTPQCVRYPNPPLTGFFRDHSLLPADIDGVNPPPAGIPEYFVSVYTPISDPPGSHMLNLWKYHVDWTNPGYSTFAGPLAITVPKYVPGCYNHLIPSATVCVPEPSSGKTNNYLDSIGDRVMHRFVYRRFNPPGSTQLFDRYFVSHTVQVGTGDLSQTGIRWYELTTGGALVTSGTISPDNSNYRFVPSVAEDKVGNLAVGYSVSGAKQSPIISVSYLNLPGKTKPTEFSIPLCSSCSPQDEENSFHWGGYTSMTVDPVDDCTFWYVNEYFSQPQTGSEVNWQTRISNFKISGCK
jgi:hypothetical protein